MLHPLASILVIVVTLVNADVSVERSEDSHNGHVLQSDDTFKAMVLSELERLTTEINTLERKLDEKDKENGELKKQVDRRAMKRQLGYTPEMEVAFSSSISQHITNLQSDQPIVFGNVLTNEGNFYNNVTGVFYAPVSGTYLFYVNILSEADNSIESELIADGHVLAEIYSGSAHFHGAGSNLVIAHVQRGQNVWVKVHATFSTDMAVHCCWSTFSGYLLRDG